MIVERHMELEESDVVDMQISKVLNLTYIDKVNNYFQKVWRITNTS